MRTLHCVPISHSLPPACVAGSEKHGVPAADALFQGWLDVYDPSKFVRHWRRHWVVLRQYSLVLYKPASKCILLAGSSVSPVCLVSRRRFSFRLIDGNGTVHRCAAKSEDEKQAWTLKIGHAAKAASTSMGCAPHILKAGCMGRADRCRCPLKKSVGSGSDSAETCAAPSDDNTPASSRQTSDDFGFLPDATDSSEESAAMSLSAILAHLNGSEALSELEKVALDDEDSIFRRLPAARLDSHMADPSTAPRAAAVVALALGNDCDAEVRRNAVVALAEAGTGLAQAAADVLLEVYHVAVDEELRSRVRELLEIIWKVHRQCGNAVASPRLTAEALSMLEHDLMSDVAAHRHCSAASGAGFGISMAEDFELSDGSDYEIID